MIEDVQIQGLGVDPVRNKSTNFLKNAVFLSVNVKLTTCSIFVNLEIE